MICIENRKQRDVVANGPRTTGTKHKREAQIAIIAIPSADAMVVTAAARGVSSPGGGDQRLPRKLCSFRIDYCRCGDGEWSPPLEKQPVPPAMFGRALANIAAGMAGNN